MIYNREQIATRAENARKNVPGTCQLWTRTMAGGLSVGDFDHDGDADAVDGWKQSTKKHPGDRRPPRGTIVSFSGGSRGYGHRAISLGEGATKASAFLIRSTDMSSTTHRWSAGTVGTVTIVEIERSMGVFYLGWSEDISGVLIPLPPKKPAPKKDKTRGPVVDRVILDLKSAKTKPGTERHELVNHALESLRAIDFLK